MAPSSILPISGVLPLLFFSLVGLNNVRITIHLLSFGIVNTTHTGLSTPNLSLQILRVGKMLMMSLVVTSFV